MVNISVIEDEPSIANMLKLNLELEGYQVTVYVRGKEVMEAFPIICSSDLIVLDVMLPDINGMDICRRIREVSEVPILFLSAKGTTEDRIQGLKAGANDYLPKPFDLEELLLRIRVLIKPLHEKQTSSHLTIGSLEINFDTFEVSDSSEGLITTLSKREIDLLRLFEEKEGQVVSRDEILDRIWGTDQFPTSRTIDNYILNFRKLFEIDPKQPQFFHSIRSVGYKFTLQR